MKGSSRAVHTKGRTLSKTNFNDWSDPKCKPLKKVAIEPKPLIPKALEELSEVENISQESVSVTSNTSIEISQLRQKIKDGYPLLSRKEIRIIRLPFHESLLLNLKEDGFIATYQFISDLLDLDEDWHKQWEKSFNRFAMSKNRPYLKLNKTALNTICDELTIAEIAKLEKDKTQEIKSFLETALYFSNPEVDTWHWLAEEFYKQCIEVAFEVDESGLGNADMEMTAIAKYLYALFLLDVLNDPKRAQLLVEKSMKLSEGRYWKVAKITGEESDILYLESCLLLHRIFLVMAQEKIGIDFEQAIQLCRSALHWAKQTNNKQAERNALLNLLIVHIKARQVGPVLSYLENYKRLCLELKDVHGLCEGYILQTDYHDLIEDEEAVVNDIQELLKLAEEHNILKMMALAHHKLAIYYLSNEKHKKMAHHGLKAYNYYVTLNSGLEIEEVKCLTGIAQAQEIMSHYIPILVEAEDIDAPEFDILTMWKSLHLPFFSNVKLLHPEAEVNENIKSRMLNAKSQEGKEAYKHRQNMMMTMSTMSFAFPKMSRTLNSESSRGSAAVATRSSKSFSNFQQQMKSSLNEPTYSHISHF